MDAGFQNMFSKFSKREQMHHLTSELLRAKHRQDDEKKFSASLRLALEIMNLLLKDPKWNDSYWLPALRDMVVKALSGQESVEHILKVL